MARRLDGPERSRRPASKPRVGVERALWLVGLLTIGIAASAWIEARVYQARQGRAFAGMLAARANHAASAADIQLGFPSTVTPSPGLDPAVLARLEIPRLRISSLVREGVDERTLRIAVGHIPGTALPGRTGNVGLAGHRDSFFRRLEKVKKGDLVRLDTQEGVKEYRVDSIEIVGPERVDLLRSGAAGSLTLVTCYPFSWIGHAPKRFVVRARVVEPAPAVAPATVALTAPR